MLRLRRFDFYLFLPAVFLLGLGTVILASVSPANFGSHLLYILISLVFFFFFSFLDLEILFPLSPLVYIFCILFLTLPFFVGTIVRGSIRWIPIGQFTVQPSEIVKPFLALIFAWYWAKKEFSFKRLLFLCALFFPIVILIFLQPDLGSTLAVLSIFVGSLFALPIKPKQIFILLGATLITLPLLLFSLKDYQRLRVVHFLDPYQDPLGEGYNLIQAKIAVGSGELLGQGFGRGTQSHLTFLPERYTDFVFASFTEETGFAGGFLILLLYLWLFFRILKIASRTLENYPHDRSFFLLSVGILFYLSFQTIVNIGMNIGLMPITGITLPLVSYGGSSLLTTMISLGILESVSSRSKKGGGIEIR